MPADAQQADLKNPTSDVRRLKFISARMEGHSVRYAAQLAGVNYRTASNWDNEGPLAYIQQYVESRGDLTKEGIQIVLSTTAVKSPVQYQAALLRLLADIKGWTKPQAEETGDRAAERLKAWLSSIAASAPKPEPAPEPPHTESPIADDTTH